jgi:hypothetical protein
VTSISQKSFPREIVKPFAYFSGKVSNSDFSPEVSCLHPDNEPKRSKKRKGIESLFTQVSGKYYLESKARFSLFPKKGLASLFFYTIPRSMFANETGSRKLSASRD